MSGLTIGLMSLTQMDLQIMQNAGTEREKKFANILLPLINKQHLLLVTLLIANAAAMEALPIFLDRLTDPYIAIVISVTLVLMFGE
jgi:metal transporter CNNM